MIYSYSSINFVYTKKIINLLIWNNQYIKNCSVFVVLAFQLIFICYYLLLNA